MTRTMPITADGSVVSWKDCPDCKGRGWFLKNPFALYPQGNMLQCASCKRAYDNEALLDLYERKAWREFFRQAVKAKKTICVTGPTGSGKTDLLKRLITEIPPETRVVTIEDTAEFGAAGPCAGGEKAMRRVALWSLAIVGSVIAANLIAAFAFIYLNGIQGRLAEPWKAWWLYTLYFRPMRPMILLHLTSSAVVGLLPLAVAATAVMRYRIGSTRNSMRTGGPQRPFERGVTDNHGHAEWMSLTEAMTRFPLPRGEGVGGVVVGEAYRIDDDPSVKHVRFSETDRATWGQGGRARLLIDDCATDSGHSMVIAGSGSYKSSCAVTTGITWTRNSVIFDPKCEMGQMLSEAMEFQGKRVVILDPKTDVGVNVLDWIDIEDPLAPMHVRTVVAWIVGEPEGRSTANDEFFRKRGQDLLVCLLSDLLWSEGTDIPKTLKILRYALSSTTLVEHLESIVTSSHSPTARHLAGPLVRVAHDAKETFASILANADGATSWLTMPAFANLVSGDSFKTSELVTGKISVFVQIPMSAMQTSPALGRVVIGALLQAMIVANGRASKTLFLIDEAMLLGKMKVLETARDQGRMYGICLHLLWQSVGQIDTIWTRDGRKAWYDGCTWRGYASIQDPDTAKEVSTMCGYLPVLAKSEGDNAGRQLSWGVGRSSRSKGRVTNIHEIRRELIKPEELMTDVRADEMIVFVRGCKPLRCGRAIWWRRREMIVQVSDSRPLAAAE